MKWNKMEEKMLTDKQGIGAEVEPECEDFHCVVAEDEPENEDMNSKATKAEIVVEEKADSRSDTAKEPEDVEGYDEASNAQVREEDECKNCNENA